MSSRKIEERNEKIIRGLMKLPPNRRCINCNSLGPQYVCTNFWTFVCMTCSGIHREFTHRVKSVSMSKFTSQEVEALQKGGNQRARETYLNDWDPQRQRVPDSSNADKVRQFIKNVYVDRKYAGGKTSDKPPRGMQDLKSHEDENRRASSYHSYSQSPPYDYQYEERRYGKHAFALTRKTGSDRGLKTSSFLSPSRLSDHVYEDSFANEGSNSRVSDYTFSTGGDPFRSDTQSPTFQRDIGFSSPSSVTSRDILSEDGRHHRVNTYSDTKAKRDADWVPHPQRTASTGSFGSFNSNSMSFKSVNSENALDVASEIEQSAGSQDNKLVSFLSLPRSSVSGNSDGIDLFNTPFASQTILSSASATNLFQLPKTSSNLAVDLFQPSSTSVSTLKSHQPPQTFPPSSLSFFSDMPHQHSAATLNERSPDVGIQKNEGWATFDVPPQHVEPSQGILYSTPATIPSNEEDSLRNFDQHLFPSTIPQWSSFQDSSAHGPYSSMPDQWHKGLHNVEAPLNAASSQSWNTFEDPIGHLSFESIYQQSSEEVAVQNPSSVADQYLGLRESEDLNKDGIQSCVMDSGLPIHSIQSHASVSSYVSHVIPVMAGALSHATDHKSTNPFDLPYDSDLESNNNMFLDMRSLQAVLPNGQTPTSVIGGVTQPWFAQNPVTAYIPAGPQGALGLLTGPAPSTQITSVPSQGPVAPIGGNPFA